MYRGIVLYKSGNNKNKEVAIKIEVSEAAIEKLSKK